MKLWKEGIELLITVVNDRCTNSMKDSTRSLISCHSISIVSQDQYNHVAPSKQPCILVSITPKGECILGIFLNLVISNNINFRLESDF